jgi:sugar lactone lactonase YvrE
MRKADEAYQKKDYSAFLDNLTKAKEMSGDNPAVLYNLACAYALKGNKVEAVKLLDKLAGMELGWDAPSDPDLASLRGNPGFQTFLGKLEGARKPVARSETAFTLAERDLFPEGIAYDPAQEAFYFTSILKRKIVVRDRAGTVTDFIAQGQDGFLSGLGATVDASRRILWVCTADQERMEGHSEGTAGLSGIFKYDLAFRKLLKKYVMDGKSGPHLLNDLVVTSQGVVFATDTLAGAVYRISPEQDDLLLLTPYGLYQYPNGIALSSDETTLFVAHASGIATVNLKTGDRGELQHGAKVFIGGIDGLSYFRGSLIGIQSSARRVARFVLNKTSDKVDRVEVLEAHNPLFAGMPTTGTLVGDTLFYIANSQVNAVGPDGKFLTADKLQEPVVLKVRPGS